MVVHYCYYIQLTQSFPLPIIDKNYLVCSRFNLRGRSETRLTSLCFLLTTFLPPVSIFVMGYGVISTFQVPSMYLPCLVNVVCECPLIGHQQYVLHTGPVILIFFKKNKYQNNCLTLFHVRENYVFLLSLILVKYGLKNEIGQF